MSQTANLPRGGHSLNTSTHIGFYGTILTMQACPDLINFGNFSNTLPDLLSIDNKIS